MIGVNTAENRCNIIGTDFFPSALSEAVRLVADERDRLAGGYICFSNVHTTVMAHDDKAYRDILNGSSYTFADGAPVAKLIRKKGYKDAERVAGPDFMEKMFELSDREPSLGSHYFYGSQERTLSLLKKNLTERYPKLKIAGMYSPPFRELSREEDIEMTDMIRASGAEFIWIGLGAPKQERFMAGHAGCFDGVMLGVGAGFDFHAGTIERAPESFQRAGFEWLYRLAKDPKRLFKRYLVTNTKFLLYTRGLRKA